MTMRWWFQVDPPYLMGVDNGSVTGMDFSAVLAADPDLWMVHWQEGRGELERQDVDNDANLNGLREEFIDLTPYVPLFQQFMELMKAKNLLLNQAKKIQIDLIKQIFEVQRQAPFHYIVAAGDYWWDASDATLYSSLIPALQNATSTINDVIAGINGLVTQINAMLDTIDSNISTYVINSVNSNIVTSGNDALTSINTQLGAANTCYADSGNAVVAHINNVLLNTDGATNSINNKLKGGTINTPDGSGGIAPATVALPGLIANLALVNVTFTYIGQNPSFLSALDAWPDLGYVSWSDPDNVPASNVQWIPIGATDPVPVTPAEQAAIMQGITDRTNQLTLIKNQKIAEVNALTDLDEVIAYDVLNGWPDMYLPPGYKLQPSGMASGGATIVGTPAPPSGGIPEAPSDGVTYGRRNAVWNPALALSGDILDGGTF